MSAIHVDLLRRAKRRIAHRYDCYVCLALGRGTIEGELAKEKDEVLRHINNLLDGYHTLESWLAAQGYHVVDRDIYDTTLSDKMRATRLAWIDSMIEYWRDKP